MHHSEQACVNGDHCSKTLLSMKGLIVNSLIHYTPLLPLSSFLHFPYDEVSIGTTQGQ
jgi:hypothetical protein